MRKFIFSALIALVVLADSPVFAAAIYYRLETDKRFYRPGETVNWTAYAWASQNDNYGIVSFRFHLDDWRNEQLNPVHHTGELSQCECVGTYYGLDKGFVLFSPGTPDADPPRLRDVDIRQDPIAVFNVGNDGDEHVLCKGSCTVTKEGRHTLSVVPESAFYWADESGTTAEFDYTILVPDPKGTFFVNKFSDISNDSIVNFADFSRLTAELPGDNCGDENCWCNGADINRDTFVDFDDLTRFANDWLWQP